MEEEEEEDEPCYTTMQEIGRGPGLIFGAACCYLAGRQGAGPAPEPPEPDQGERGSWKVTSQPLERERERDPCRPGEPHTPSAGGMTGRGIRGEREGGRR